MKNNDSADSGKLRDTFKNPAVVVFLAGTLLTLMLSVWALKVAAGNVRLKFEKNSDGYIAMFRTILNDQKQELSAMQRAIEVLDSNFDRKAFQKLATPILRFSEVHNIVWIPVVPHDKRAALEGDAGREGLNVFQIKELTTEGTFRVAGRRDTYFPLNYIEPQQGNEILAGFDIGSNASRLDAINAAIKSGGPQASGPITLLQDKDQRHSFILVVPVRSSDARIRGFVAGAYRADDILKNSLAATDPAGLTILLTDLSASPGERELALYHSRLKLNTSLSGVLASLSLPLPENNHALYFAGRHWNVTIKATPEFLQQNAQLESLAILPVGILITVGMAVFLRTRRKYLHKISETEEQVRQKDKFARSILDGLNLNICVIDQQGTIVATNRAWNEFAAENNAAPGTCGEGSNYLHAIRATSGKDSDDVSTFKAELTAVLNGAMPELCRDYPCHSPEAERWFTCKANSFDVGELSYAVVSHENIILLRHLS